MRLASCPWQTDKWPAYGQMTCLWTNGICSLGGQTGCMCILSVLYGLTNDLLMDRQAVCAFCQFFMGWQMTCLWTDRLYVHSVSSLWADKWPAYGQTGCMCILSVLYGLTNDLLMDRQAVCAFCQFFMAWQMTCLWTDRLYVHSVSSLWPDKWPAYGQTGCMCILSVLYGLTNDLLMDRQAVCAFCQFFMAWQMTCLWTDRLYVHSVSSLWA